MTNVDTRLTGYKTRLLNLEGSRRAAAEDKKELRKEMRSTGLSKAEIAGVFLAVRREFESAEKAADRTAAEEIAEALGGFVDTPLGHAAMGMAHAD